jgi:aquaporin Z
MLVAVGPGSAMIAAATGGSGDLGVSAAFGVIVAIIVATLGPISAHVNPSVTLACSVTGRLRAREVLPYISARCAGAVPAAIFVLWLVGPRGGFGATVPRVDLLQAIGAESAWSGLLMYVIVRVTASKTPSTLLAPCAIGATVFVGALTAGPLTGGSFDPARTLGPAMAGAGWTAHWLRWIAPTSGMIVGAVLADRLARPPSTGTSR